MEDQLTHDESEPKQGESQNPCTETEATPLANQHSLALGRSRRANFRKPPMKYGFEDVVAYTLQVAEEVDSHEPSTYKEAVTCSECTQWIAVMGDEMESLQKNKTWELVKRLLDRKIITYKWVLKKKEGVSPTEGVKYKARLVARGFSQEKGVDYTEIFSPVVRHTSIRVLLAMVAH